MTNGDLRAIVVDDEQLARRLWEASTRLAGLSPA